MKFAAALVPLICAITRTGCAREAQTKSPVRPELVEGLVELIDCYRFNPIMVRQVLMEQLSID